ncbi:ribosome assembly RNA-binding protein YhbY [Aliiglaciecola sp. SL4]|uniref:ribosome assembly RNA-binding protein YhbY n=1 Tax=Aliiglaciecola sp. SL4 TaxID=3239806 RepID=UPI00355BE902
MKLSNKQKQYLKGLAHPLKPIVQLGNNGLTEGVLAEIDNALSFHELIKVKVPSDDREEKQLIMDAIIRETSAVKLQVIGHTLIMFRQSEDKKISIPKV